MQNICEMKQTCKGDKMTDKKPLGMVVVIIVLVIIVIALGMTLISNTSPLDKAMKKYLRDYQDSTISIQKITGDNAQLTAPELKSICPDLNLPEYYLAQIDNFALQKKIILLVNPLNGNIACTLDKSTNINATKAALDQNLLLTVNDEPVYIDEVRTLYNSIPAETRTNTSMQDALEQVINNKLLLQDAVKKGLAVNDSEVDYATNAFMSSNGLTAEQLETNIMNAGSTMSAFRESVRKNLLLQKEIILATKDSPAATEAQAQGYYAQNPQSFVTKASAQTRQLLLYANESNDAEKLTQIKGIATMINATNFCEMVGKYSEDLVSVPRCGEYDFEEGQLLPEYEQVVFNSTPASAKIAKTRMGYHIVLILNVTLPKQLSYEEVKGTLLNFISIQIKQEVLNQYIGTLRQQANIVSYVKQ